MSFKDFNADTKKSVQSNLNQVIDVIQEDVSGSATRRKYQTFVTGGIGPGVTSSLYQTVYDQDFTLQTANPIVDMTVGLFHADGGSAATKRLNLVTVGTNYTLSSTTGQILFDAKSTMMMREKVNIYRQYANYLLGDPDAAFILDPDNYPSSTGKTEFNVTTDATVIDAALFLNVKRLFSRDGIRKETFAIRLYKNAPQWDTAAATGKPYDAVSNNGSTAYDYFYGRSADGSTVKTGNPTLSTPFSAEFAPSPALDFKSNVFERNISNHNVLSSEQGVQILADLTAAQSFKSENAAGDVALLRLASDSKKIVGLVFYQAGIVVLNLGGSSVLTGTTLETGSTLDVGLGQLGLDGAESIEPVFEVRDPIHGIISGMDNQAGFDGSASPLGVKTAGQIYIGGTYDGGPSVQTNQGSQSATAQNKTSGPQVTFRQDQNSMNMGPATFYPDLLVSASIDDIIDHIGYTRFSSGSLTGLAFQNQTKINSSIYFCRASANEFNTSSNPTFLDDDGIPVMIVDADNDKPFTYITTVALADSQGDVVAIAKLNRPIEKNDESEVTIRVRLDF